MSTNGNRVREFGSVAKGGRSALSGLLNQEQELSNHQANEQMDKHVAMVLLCL